MSGTKKINKALLTFTKVLDVLDAGIAETKDEQKQVLVTIESLKLRNNILNTICVNGEIVATNLRKLLNVKGG